MDARNLALKARKGEEIDFILEISEGTSSANILALKTHFGLNSSTVR